MHDSPSPSLCSEDTLGTVQGQHNPYRKLLSEPRLQPYLLDADQDLEKAWAMYLWTNELAGALHALIALVEVAVRNALDRELSDWNAFRSGERAWTLHGNAEEPLYSLVKDDLNKTRKAAKRAAHFRASEHPRYGVDPTHDDVVAQLMFGTWVKLLRRSRPAVWWSFSRPCGSVGLIMPQ